MATPAARKLAREKGIDLRQVEVVDPIGRVNKQYVEGISKNSEGWSSQLSKQSPYSSSDRQIEIVKMSSRRKTIAKRLVDVQHTAAILTTFNEVDMSAVINLRKKRKDDFQETHDVKLGFMSFFTRR